MQFNISSPRLPKEDPGYVAACEAAIEAALGDMIASLSDAAGSEQVAYRIANAALFPEEHPVAAARLAALTTRARTVGWAEFAITKALPMAVAKITVPLIDPTVSNAGPHA
jgi:hypothetical protein